MLKNYLLIALRTLRKEKGYAALNVVGLAIGMACCLLILLYIRDERSYDRFHENADRIARVVRERQRSPNEWGRLALTPWRLAPMLKENLPQVEKTVRIAQREMLVRVGDAQHPEPRFFLADSTALDVFTFPLLRGDPETALRAPYTVLLTETTAEKYFGDADPIGQVLTVENEHAFTVTGVVADVPAQSHLHFDFLASMSSAEAMWGENRERFESMGAVWLYTYLLLEPETEVATLEAEMPALIDAMVPIPNASSRFRLPLQPLTDIHLHSNYDGEIEPNGSIERLYFLGVLAGFILLLACINFMNLATARSARRTREVGVRKALGARRGQLAGQFLGEAVLLSVGALVVAVVLVQAVLPAFNGFTEKALTLSGEPLLLGVLLALALGVGVLAGSYPAFYLSSFRPAAVLKGVALPGRERGAARLRQGLVVLQFAITIGLLVGTATVYRQLRFIQDQALGFEKEHVAVVSLNHPQARQDVDVFKTAIAAVPGVRHVAAGSNAPPDGLNTWGIGWDGAPAEVDPSIRVMAVDYDYLETLGLTVTAGRALAEDRPTDAASAFLLNEAAVAQFGFEEPIGQDVRFTVGDEVVKEGTVVGVVEDFHLASLHEEVRPVLLTVRPSWYGMLLVRFEPGAAPEALAAIEETWQALAPDWPLEMAFLDDRVDQLYRAEQRLGQLFGYFAGLALVIACLGLFGLASFVAARRTKEIGVRKVLGASVLNVVGLLVRDFARPVLLAAVVAAPLAYVAMREWLDGFAYHVTLGPGVFVVAGLVALAIALLTVSVHALRAATADPVQSLRAE